MEKDCGNKGEIKYNLLHFFNLTIAFFLSFLNTPLNWFKK